MTHPVKWHESLSYVMEQGVVEFEELGPGQVLTKMVSQIRADASARRPHGQDGSVEDKVSAWNKSYPVGTRVRSKFAGDTNARTRTGASVLFGLRAVVYLEGFNGYFDLDELSAEV
jgi:hypothetical protein